MFQRKKSIFLQIEKHFCKAFLLFCCLFLTRTMFSQTVDIVRSPTVIETIKGGSSVKQNRERGLYMLSEVKKVVKERYYDPNFRGMNLDERFKSAEENIKKSEANWQIFGIIAQVLLEFNDSHTRFYPPNRANRVEYGFSLQMVGNRCFVTDVKKGSDAEARGLKVGDTLLAVGRYSPTRENLWKINYLLYALNPQEILNLSVADSDNKPREIQVKAVFKSIEEREKEYKKRSSQREQEPYKCQEISPVVIACKLYSFSVEKTVVDKMMKAVGGHQKLILDLRGNGGGYIKTEEYLTGYFFDRNVKVGDLVMRKKTVERIAKPVSFKLFKGDLIVLVDSNSASASEIFARVVQLEKRGKIVGDVSAGAVMTSNFLQQAKVSGGPGFEKFTVFGLNLTIGDFVMSDGKRLENVGVIPDVLIGPNGKALAERRDPILAYSAQLLGADIGDEQAGKYKFMTANPEDANEEENKAPDNNDDDGGN